MNKATLETSLRNDVIAHVSKALADIYETDVLQVSASEITIPVLDAENNDKFVLIKISIPRGTRNGNGGYDVYDGYAAAESYKAELEEKASKKAASAAKKEAAEKLREQKRALRATKKAE